jgi:hypothetical protein
MHIVHATRATGSSHDPNAQVSSVARAYVERRVRGCARVELDPRSVKWKLKHSPQRVLRIHVRYFRTPPLHNTTRKYCASGSKVAGGGYIRRMGRGRETPLTSGAQLILAWWRAPTWSWSQVTLEKLNRLLMKFLIRVRRNHHLMSNSGLAQPGGKGEPEGGRVDAHIAPGNAWIGGAGGIGRPVMHDENRG